VQCRCNGILEKNTLLVIYFFILINMVFLAAKCCKDPINKCMEPILAMNSQNHEGKKKITVCPSIKSRTNRLFIIYYPLKERTLFHFTFCQKQALWLRMNSSVFHPFPLGGSFFSFGRNTVLKNVLRMVHCFNLTH